MKVSIPLITQGVIIMKDGQPIVDLKTRITRYVFALEMLERHPEEKDMLQKRVDKYRDDLLEYVTSKDFRERIEYFNL